MTDYAIEIENISKKYFIGSLKSRNNTLQGQVQLLLQQPVKRLRALWSGKAPTHVDKEIWALRNINLKIRQGESLGIIGRNGSGKSTLLQLVASVVTPTEGQVITRGQIVAMLNVGTGFHPELTGRENVYINASILGLSTKEVDAIYDDIVAFAEIEEFMDTPLKRYSSGMRVRLAFSVAINIQPEIIILDEVLAVGDRGFRRKSLDAMAQTHQDTTLLVASHNVNQLKRICDRVIWLDNGQLMEDGDPESVINSFLSKIMPSSDETRTQKVRKSKVGEAGIELQQVLLQHPQNDNFVQMSIRSAAGLKIIVNYVLHQPMMNLRVTCNILHEDTEALVFSTSDADTEPRHQESRPKGEYSTEFQTQRNLFTPGKYYIDIRFEHPGERVVATWRQVCTFRVIDVDSKRTEWFEDSRAGYINLETDWHYSKWAEPLSTQVQDSEPVTTNQIEEL